MKTNQFSPALQKWYFLYIHKQIFSKVPISLYYVGPGHPSGNCYISCFLTEKTPLNENCSGKKSNRHPSGLENVPEFLPCVSAALSYGSLHNTVANFWILLQSM